DVDDVGLPFGIPVPPLALHPCPKRPPVLRLGRGGLDRRATMRRIHRGARVAAHAGPHFSTFLSATGSTIRVSMPTDMTAPPVGRNLTKITSTPSRVTRES